MIRFIWCLILIKLNTGAKLFNCPTSDVRFDKIIGVRPPVDKVQQILLYKPPAKNELNPVTLECISKCQMNAECGSFILYYNSAECYWLRGDPPQSQFNLIDNDVAWFVKTCLVHGGNCNKSWTFERIPGAILIGNDTKSLPQPLTRSQCRQECLDEKQFKCRSIKFRSNYKEMGKNETAGECTLSDADRHLLPNSYRVSTFDEEYFENQCADLEVTIVANSTYPNREFCAYEEYENVILGHSDVMFDNKTKEECQTICNQFQSFNCRGFSIINGNINRCYLHSEDSKIHGPKLLKSSPYSNYYEKARCLNIQVSCSETYITVKYAPEMNFHGKIYMQGYSEDPQCYAVGQGKFTIITLKMSLLASQCGITKADSLYNRTLLSGTMVLQYNPLIQTQSDRIIKIGCIFGNESKVLIGTGVKITSSLPNKGSTLLNTSSNETISPVVEMRVVDAASQNEVSETQIGQELQLQIKLQDNDREYDIWASHLVAMTEKGDESIFLLDDRGCPTNLNIFPPIMRSRINGTRMLSATFQAFKFASSPIVRFSVIIQFCQKECSPVQCDNSESYGRRKRELKSHTLQTAKGNTVVQSNMSNFQIEPSVINQMPLEYIMVVRDPNSKADRLILGDNKILVAGYNYNTNEICVDYSLLVGLCVTWILIQLILVICCFALVRRYKKYYQDEYLRMSMNEIHKNFGIGFSNLDNRRVHWADNGDNVM